MKAKHRGSLYALLATVAGAAAVLSFAALRDLAQACGFEPHLAWLLPITIDAGAAAGSIVWLGSWSAPAAARYARILALVLLAGSVAGNALGHGLAAYGTKPHWVMVVGVSAIAPSVLGALVHLVVIVLRATPVADTPPVVAAPPAATPDGDDTPDLVVSKARELIAAGAGRPKLRAELGVTDHRAKQLIDELRQPATNGAVYR